MLTALLCECYTTPHYNSIIHYTTQQCTSIIHYSSTLLHTTLVLHTTFHCTKLHRAKASTTYQAYDSSTIQAGSIPVKLHHLYTTIHHHSPPYTNVTLRPSVTLLSSRSGWLSCGAVEECAVGSITKKIENYNPPYFCLSYRNKHNYLLKREASTTCLGQGVSYSDDICLVVSKKFCTSNSSSKNI